MEKVCDMSLLKGWVLPGDCCIDSELTLWWFMYLFRHVFPHWQLFERKVGFSPH